MGESRKPDFSGWATKNNLECSDGRTIMSGAFKHQDKARVPLVWQHDHQDPSNVLGHAILENRAFGVYAEGFFNNSPRARDAKEAVVHGDINALSIYANKLKQRQGKVLHGNIIEVSLVMTGANPGAFIENVHIAHSDDGEEIPVDAIIYTGLEFQHVDLDESEDVVIHADNDSKSGENMANEEGPTVEDVFNTLTEEQKNVVYFMIGQALEDADKDKDPDEDDVEHSMSSDDFLAHIKQSIQEGMDEMGRKTFEHFGDAPEGNDIHLSHSQFSELVASARDGRAASMMDVLKAGASDVLQHDGVAGVDYGVGNIDYLFPDAKAVSNEPDFIKRRTEWVHKVLTTTKHSPFAKVKTIHADITEPEARAKGYITGKMKKEEVFSLLKRTTGPTTVYKKQKLDRDDMLDITDFNVVVWLQQEMRLMLEEEVARAILIGDGRSASSDDKVKDPAGALQGEGIRSILNDSPLYVTTVTLPADATPKDAVKAIQRARSKWKGSGRPDFYLGDEQLTDFLQIEDGFERPMYDNTEKLAGVLRVREITEVEVFDEVEDLFGIMVNLQDYTVGTNKGGEITNFNQFDIDFNQEKYLQETRISGGLTRPFSAVVIKKASAQSVTPEAPNWNAATNTITIPTQTGVIYTIDGAEVTGSIIIDEDTEVEAEAAAGYSIPSGATKVWNYTYTP